MGSCAQKDKFNRLGHLGDNRKVKKDIQRISQQMELRIMFH
jgi:hypothetical protein